MSSERTPSDPYGWRLHRVMVWAHRVARPLRSALRNRRYLRSQHRLDLQRGRTAMHFWGAMIQDAIKPVDHVVRLLDRFEFMDDIIDYEQSPVVMFTRYSTHSRGKFRGDCDDAARLAEWALRQAGYDTVVVYLYGDTRSHAVCMTRCGRYLADNGTLIDLAHAVGGFGSLETVLHRQLGEPLRYTYPHISSLRTV